MAPISRYKPSPPFVQLESIAFGQLLYETHINGTFPISSLVANFLNMVNNEGYPLPQQYPLGRLYLRYDENKKLHHVWFMGVYGLYGEKAFAMKYKPLMLPPGHYPQKGTDNWPWCKSTYAERKKQFDKAYRARHENTKSVRYSEVFLFQADYNTPISQEKIQLDIDFDRLGPNHEHIENDPLWGPAYRLWN
ncbi:hypothetical protein EV356DRAFT_529350 [Viridothelium virens]|uniref:Uncharacterized protein n=1 Tax=Viridothelium virens TaxID=1048519 RepID=A0A6A6HKF5_VIRVR|nr:hypothetical protein EV356DRAFT_529350 [Viridothelium virens]